MTYEEKYNKYKQKYLNLLTKINVLKGGNREEEYRAGLLLLNEQNSIRRKQKKIIQKGSGKWMDKLLSEKFKEKYQDFINTGDDNPVKITTTGDISIIPEFDHLLRFYLNKSLLDELNKLDEQSLKKYKSDNHKFFSGLFQDIMIDERPPSLRYFKDISDILFSFKRQKVCKTEEFMIYDKNFDIDVCLNYNDYKGSCGFPALNQSINNQCRNVDKIIILFNKIKEKLQRNQTIGIILGSIKDHEFQNDYDINLYFNMCEDSGWKSKKCDEYKEIDVILWEIDNLPLKKDYLILNYFPLNTHPSNKPLLDLIVDLTESFYIKLVNNMCGTCFGSFYYLKKNTKCKKSKFQYLSQSSRLSSYDPKNDPHDPNQLNMYKCFID